MVLSSSLSSFVLLARQLARDGWTAPSKTRTLAGRQARPPPAGRQAGLLLLPVWVCVGTKTGGMNAFYMFWPAWYGTYARLSGSAAGDGLKLLASCPMVDDR